MVLKHCQLKRCRCRGRRKKANKNSRRRILTKTKPAAPYQFPMVEDYYANSCNNQRPRQSNNNNNTFMIVTALQQYRYLLLHRFVSYLAIYRVERRRSVLLAKNAANDEIWLTTARCCCGCRGRRHDGRRPLQLLGHLLIGLLLYGCQRHDDS
jgi:hypothetical protein